MQSLSSYPVAFFRELQQIILKCVWKHKRPQIAKEILKKKNGTEEIRFLEFRLYYKARVIKTVMALAQKQKYRSMGQDRKPRNKPKNLWSTNL